MATDKKMMLIEASIELFYKQGFWKSSTASIAKHAKVATGTLFNYFASKEQLIDEVYLHIKAELLHELRNSYAQLDDDAKVSQILENQWRSYVIWGIDNPVKHSLVQQLKLSDLVSDQAQQTGMQSFSAMFEMLQKILDSGELKTLDIESFAELFHAQLEAAIIIAKRKALSGKALTAHVAFSYAIFWDGVKKQPAQALTQS